MVDGGIEVRALLKGVRRLHGFSRLGGLWFYGVQGVDPDCLFGYLGRLGWVYAGWYDGGCRE